MRHPSLVLALFSTILGPQVNAQTQTVTVTITRGQEPSQPSATWGPASSAQLSPVNKSTRTSRTAWPPTALQSTAIQSSPSAPWVATGTASAPKGIASLASGLASSVRGILGQPTAKTESGTIFGSTVNVPNAAKVHQFLGVPFAESPPKRWTPPEHPRRWTIRREATKVMPACFQQFNAGPNRNFTVTVFNDPPPVESEDCLYLNVYTPDGPTQGRGRAVLFWLYGGSLQFGSAGQPGYNGSYIAAKQDVVVVTANYRTNVFGFPNSPEIPLRERNLGFLDQRAALHWIQDNIEEFGGDPTKVTVFGESAGAASADALLTSYAKNSVIRPPFRAAILQSGQIGIRRANLQASPATQYANWDKLASEAKCVGTSSAILACLKRLPAQMIKAIVEVNKLSFNPQTDGATLVSTPEAKRRSGQLHNFPVLVGSNAQEGRVFQMNQNNLTKYLETTFPNNPQLQSRVRAAYPLGQDGLKTDYDVISQIMTELAFGCPSAIFANDSVTGGYPTWRYYFNATFPNLQKFPDAGVYHASEIELIFGTYGKLKNAVSALPSPREEVWLSDYMMTAWAKFAKNPTQGPGWVRTGSQVQDVAVLGGGSSGGVYLIRGLDVDWRCSLYSSFY